MSKSMRFLLVVSVAAMTVAFLAVGAYKVSAADCCTKEETAACNVSPANGSCNGGIECITETDPAQTSAECGVTKITVDSARKTCVSIPGHVINCENSGVAYGATKYTCYCKDDWGGDGTCTMATHLMCQYSKSVLRGPC